MSDLAERVKVELVTLIGCDGYDCGKTGHAFCARQKIPIILALIERERERVRVETIEKCIAVSLDYDNTKPLAIWYGRLNVADELALLIKEPPCPK